MPSVFDTSRCSLSSIAGLPSGAFKFTEDCSVPQAPPPIYDVPDLEFDIPNIGPIGPEGVPGIQGFDGVIGQDAPCTGLSLAVDAALLTYKRTVNAAKLTFKLSKVPDTYSSSIVVSSLSSQSYVPLVCKTTWAANMSLSLPCPEFDISGSLVTLAFSDSSATLEVDRSPKYPETDQCGEIVKFKFKLPKTATWRSGVGPPPIGLGTNGDYYLDLGDGTLADLGNGDVWRKLNGVWTGPITNIKGDDGSSGIMPCCPQTTYASIVTGVYCQGNQLIVMYQS